MTKCEGPASHGSQPANWCSPTAISRSSTCKGWRQRWGRAHAGTYDVAGDKLTITSAGRWVNLKQAVGRREAVRPPDDIACGDTLTVTFSNGSVRRSSGRSGGTLGLAAIRRSDEANSLGAVVAFTIRDAALCRSRQRRNGSSPCGPRARSGAPAGRRYYDGVVLVGNRIDAVGTRVGDDSAGAEISTSPARR